MKKILLITVLVLVVILALTAVVSANGGGGNKSYDVCWIEENTKEQRAFFIVTGSGVIQQHRYIPANLHLIFKPADEFDGPEGDGWFSWPWKTDNYKECDDWPGDTLVDVFGEEPATYWVKINDQ